MIAYARPSEVRVAYNLSNDFGRPDNTARSNIEFMLKIMSGGYTPRRCVSGADLELLSGEVLRVEGSLDGSLHRGVVLPFGSEGSATITGIGRGLPGTCVDYAVELYHP